MTPHVGLGSVHARPDELLGVPGLEKLHVSQQVQRRESPMFRNRPWLPRKELPASPLSQEIR
jgi:hypothetical protein